MILFFLPSHQDPNIKIDDDIIPSPIASIPCISAIPCTTLCGEFCDDTATTTGIGIHYILE
jgi:hypothetical protein